AGVPCVPATQAPSFSETLRGAIGGVNEAQQKSGALAKAFEMGDPSADLARVMVASQQSQVAFRATVEVRNRLVQAYQDVMNMPL
ncbi:flagellar hook-basal body complex protein FliE, partial [Xanthomonas fragariae]|uniref:flagellar hook-basal body complex protein FliE n=1 Tax=Xanthomonas fragariae TaxID=48664 RepID=UPI000D555548